MGFSPQNAVVWTEIPVRDMDAAKVFYSEVFGYEFIMDESGPEPQAIFPGGEAMTQGVHGHLKTGTPAAPGTGPLLHLAVPGKLEDAMERFAAAGGKVVSPPITIPPGRFAYGLDPDGNSIGLFEPAA